MDFDPSTAVTVFPEDEQPPDDLRGYFDAPDLPAILPAPLQPHASDFLDAAQEYNLNPRVLAAISMLETDSGKSKAFRIGQNAMGISDARGPVAQPSVRDSIFKMARTLSNPRGPYAKAKTLDEFGAIYAPPGAGNDFHGTNEGWAEGVRSHLSRLGGSGRPQGDVDTGVLDTDLFDPSTAAPITEPAPTADDSGFDPSTASTIIPEQVAEEAAKATIGGVQALDVMSAPGKFDWSDVAAKNQSERQAKGMIAADVLRKKGLDPSMATNPTFAPLLDKSDDPELLAAVQDFRSYDAVRQETKAAEATLLAEQEKELKAKEDSFNQWAATEGATAPPDVKYSKWMETTGHAMTDLAQFEKWQELHGTKPNAVEAGMSQFSGSVLQQLGATTRSLSPSGQGFSDAANTLSEAGQMEKGVAQLAGQGTAAQIGRGAGSFAGMMLGTPAGKAGLALGSLRGAAEASEATLAQGGSSADAKSAALQTLPALAAYMFGGHLAGKLAGRMMGAEAGVAARTAASTGANLAANTAAGSIIRAMEGQDWVPTAETLTMDTLFALHGGHGVFKDASAVARERAGQALQEADAAMSRISKATRAAGAENRPTVVEAASVAAEPARPATPPLAAPTPPQDDNAPIADVIQRNQPKEEPIIEAAPTETPPIPIESSGKTEPAPVEGASVPVIVSTAINAGDGGLIRGAEWNSPHASFTKDAIAAGWDMEDAGRGFIVRDPDGSERFVSRTEAYEIAGASGQRAVENSKGELNSQDLAAKVPAPSEKQQENIPENIPPPEPEQLPPPPEEVPPPKEAKATTEGPIGIRNAVTGALRKELGLPDRVTPELRNFDTLHTEATEALKADPEAGNRLVADLDANPGKMLSDTEDAIATFELNRRRMARNEASRRVNEAKTPEERERALADFTRLDNETIKMIGLLERTGTESARGLNARRLMIEADYSKSRMLEMTRTWKNKGKELSAEQVQEIEDLSTRFGEIDKELAAKDEKEKAEAAKETFDQVLRQTQKEAKSAAKSKKSVIDFLTEKEAEAKKRIVERRGKLQVTIDPIGIAHLVDEAIIGAAHIARGIRDFGEWSKRMLADFGKRIEPVLDKLWNKANELHAGYEKEFKGTAKTPDEILKSIDPKKGPTQKQVFDLARAHINEGVEGFEPVMEATRKDLETVYPGITTRQVHDAYSQYGKTTIPSKEADLVKLREYRALSRLQSQLEDAINKVPPLKTGPQRDKATARVRELQKQVKDAMRKAGIETRSEEQQLSSALDAAKTRMRNDIEEMDRAIETKTPRPENKSKLEYDAEAKALKDKRDAKKAEYEAIFGKNEKTIEERQEAAIKSLDARIAEEDAMLQAGIAKRPKREGTSTPETPEMTRKRAELDAMRKLRRDLAKEAKPPKDEATLARERLEADKKRIRTANEKIRDRINRRDYAPKEKRVPEMDQEKIDLLYEKQQLQRKFNDDLIEAKRADRGVGKRVFDAGTESLNLVRQVLTSGDLPPILRQGLFTLMNPTVSGPGIGRSLKAMVSNRWRFEEDLKIKRNKYHNLAEVSGLNLPNAETTSLAKQEEEHAGRFFRELPRWTILGPLLRMSERSYNTFISSIRMDLFEKMMKSYSVDPTDLATTKRMADIINTITGRASLPGKKLEQAAPAANLALFATRYTMSRFKVALGEPLWTGNAKTRTFAIEQYARLLAGAAAIYGVAWKFGANVETDPRSANFGKIDMGNGSFFDPMAGLTQVTTLMTRLITGETKTSKTGELVPLRESGRPLQFLAPHLSAKGKPNPLIGSASDVMTQFARTKLAPVPGEIWNLLAGQDLAGKKATFNGKYLGIENFPGGGTLSRIGAPISFQDILKTMEKQGMPKGAAMWILSLWGGGLSNRDAQQKTGGMRLSL